jgi:dihydrofolate reductase
MGNLIVSENVTLDGVIQDPAGDEGLRVGGWAGLIKDHPGAGKLAARWPSQSGQLPDRLNSLPKYVVSSTLEEPDWNNSTVLKGDVASEVSRLKQELNAEIVVPASFQLVCTLMQHDLVDELRLKVYPVVLGAGQRLFGETSDKKPMRPTRNETIDDGVVYLIYKIARAT